jgi:GNAT superfamily N-acetyltransferase
MTAYRVNMCLAASRDIASLIELDLIAQRDVNRAAFIEHAVTAAKCWIATKAGDDSSVAGYGVLNQTFFEQNFVPLIVVGEGARRMGIGLTILRELASQCHGSKLFTSTNASNTPMRALLLKCGFVESGYIDNLDEGDRKLIFVRLTTVIDLQSTN